MAAFPEFPGGQLAADDSIVFLPTTRLLIALLSLPTTGLPILARRLRDRRLQLEVEGLAATSLRGLVLLGQHNPVVRLQPIVVPEDLCLLSLLVLTLQAPRLVDNRHALFRVIDLELVERLAIPGLELLVLSLELHHTVSTYKPWNCSTGTLNAALAVVVLQSNTESLQLAGGVVLGLPTRLALQNAQQVIGVLECDSPLVQLDPVTPDQRQVGPIALDRHHIQLVRQVHRPRRLLDLHPMLGKWARFRVTLLITSRCHHAGHRDRPPVGKQMESGRQLPRLAESASHDHSDRERQITLARIGQRNQHHLPGSSLLRLHRP